MKLSTYNFLTSTGIKGVKVGYPLKLTITKQSVVESEFEDKFILRLLPKLDWSVVYGAAQVAGLGDSIPPTQPDDIAENSALQERLHHLLCEVDVIEGQLECPETGRVFPITDGIPNMLLNEDEV